MGLHFQEKAKLFCYRQTERILTPNLQGQTAFSGPLTSARTALMHTGIEWMVLHWARLRGRTGHIIKILILLPL